MSNGPHGLLGLSLLQTMRARALRVRAALVRGDITTAQILKLIDDHERLIDAYTLARGQILGWHPLPGPPP